MEISGNYEIYSNFGKFIESMEINEKILQSMEIYGNLWKFMGLPWIFRDLWKFWKSMEICGKNAIYGNLWKFMEIYDFRMKNLKDFVNLLTLGLDVFARYVTFYPFKSTCVVRGHVFLLFTLSKGPTWANPPLSLCLHCPQALQPTSNKA